MLQKLIGFFSVFFLNIPGVVFTNIPNLSLVLVIKFVLVKIGPNSVFTKHVLARTIFLILS